MQRISNKKSDTFLIIETLLVAVIILSTLLLKSEIVSLAFAASFIVLLIEFLKELAENPHDSKLTLAIIISLTTLLSVTVNAVSHNNAINFEYIKNALIFIATIIFFNIAADRQMNKKTAYTVMTIQVVIAGMYPFAYFFLPMDQTIRYNAFGEAGFSGLYLNFSNPNLTGMWLLQSILYMMFGFFFFKKRITKLICVIFAAMDIWLMTLTEARNTLLSLVLFAVLVGWVFIKGRNKLSNGFIMFLTVLPGAFVPLYLAFINVIVEKGWLDFLIGKGKSLTSRVEVWNFFFEKIEGEWFFGNYAEASGNAHNSYMVVLCSFGIVVLILTVVFLNNIAKRVNFQVTNKYQAIAFTAYFATMFTGFGEGSIFVGCVGIYLSSGTFLILARCDELSDFSGIERENRSRRRFKNGGYWNK